MTPELIAVLERIAKTLEDHSQHLQRIAEWCEENQHITERVNERIKNLALDLQDLL